VSENTVVAPLDWVGATWRLSSQQGTLLETGSHWSTSYFARGGSGRVHEGRLLQCMPPEGNPPTTHRSDAASWGRSPGELGMDVEAAKPFRHRGRRPGRAGRRSSGVPCPHAGDQLGGADDRRHGHSDDGNSMCVTERAATATPCRVSPDPRTSPDVLHGRKPPAPARATSRGSKPSSALMRRSPPATIGGEPCRPSNQLVHAFGPGASGSSVPFLVDVSWGPLAAATNPPRCP
jgi:hypothetical protein